MPELAEVEHSRRQWDPGLGHVVKEVLIARPEIRVFRDTDTDILRHQLPGLKLLDSQARGKQMLFHFSGDLWLGIHLGMSGELRHEPEPEQTPRKHDHLILRQAGRALIFEDKRHFGRVRLHQGTQPPDWWNKLPAGVLSDQFTQEKTAAFFARRKRTPVKGVLLMQEHFLGVGNWMADEILWRSGVHPAIPAGELSAEKARSLWAQTQWVSRTAMQIISDDWTYPADWLFSHRWEAGGNCPRCQTKLERATIGGRTTCWCPACQPEPTVKQSESKGRKTSAKRVATKEGASNSQQTTVQTIVPTRKAIKQAKSKTVRRGMVKKLSPERSRVK